MFIIKKKHNKNIHVVIVGFYVLFTKNKNKETNIVIERTNDRDRH